MSERTTKTVVTSAVINNDGGVHVVRSLGIPQLPDLDPFLLMDEFRSITPGGPMAGIPMHPHRGFEAVTVMLAGSMHHEDSRGNVGDVPAGGVQWMTAGRGLLHSERPQQENGLMWGFQLWVNLPAKDKMSEARYQDIAADSIPEVHHEQARARVISGDFQSVAGPARTSATEPLLWDISLSAGSRSVFDVPASHNAYIYPFEGGARIGGRRVERGQAAVLRRDGDTVVIEAESEDVRVLLVAGKPIGEPIAKGGPFVMNTRAEIERAFADYRAGRLT